MALPLSVKILASAVAQLPLPTIPKRISNLVVNQAQTYERIFY
jgi:hypothetical protein